MRGNSSLDKAVSMVPSAIQEELRSILEKRALIPADVAARWAKLLDKDIYHVMMMLVPVAQQYARVPISNYYVGAVALGVTTKNLYFGSNFEFDHEALSFSVHAEQSALTNAMLNGEQGLESIAISAAPCGYCRQFLYETVTAEKLEIITQVKKPNGSGDITMRKLTDLLPEPFGPHDLGVTGGLMEFQSHDLVTDEDEDPLVKAGLKAANGSYAPYTNDYSAVALEIGPELAIYAGCHCEDAAYNPSMSPLESALTFANMNRPPQSNLEIKRAVLVESVSKISQKGATETVLSAYAPSIKLEYVEARLPTLALGLN